MSALLTRKSGMTPYLGSFQKVRIYWSFCKISFFDVEEAPFPGPLEFREDEKLDGRGLAVFSVKFFP